MRAVHKETALKIFFNLLLLSSGAFLEALAVKGIFMPHSFLSGGVFGLSLFTYYSSGLLSPGAWYALLSVPIAFIAWRLVSLSGRLLADVDAWFVEMTTEFAAAATRTRLFWIDHRQEVLPTEK